MRGVPDLRVEVRREAVRMTSSQAVRWFVRPLLFLLAAVPFLLLVRDIATGNLAAEPVKDVTLRTGLAGLQLLLATLLVTPLRRLTGLGALMSVRRMLGLFAFFYVFLHFLTYGLDQTVLAGQGLSPALIWEDVLRRPYITVGFTAFVLLMPLAVTSTTGWVKRLGGKRWQALHRLVYVAAALGVLHFLWLVKADLQRPATYGLGLVVLLGVRLWRRRRMGRAGSRQPARDVELGSGALAGSQARSS